MISMVLYMGLVVLKESEMNVGEETVTMPLHRFKEVESLLKIRDSLDKTSFEKLVEFYDKLPVAEFIRHIEYSSNRFSHYYSINTKDEALRKIFKDNDERNERLVKQSLEKFSDQFERMTVTEFKRWKKFKGELEK